MAQHHTINKTTLYDGSNFALWKYSVSLLLEAQDLMDYQSNVTEPNRNSAGNEWKEWKAKTYNAIIASSEMSNNEKQFVWIADSDASMHMTPHEEIFRELRPSNEIKYVIAAGGKVLSVVGIGTIDIIACVNGKQEDLELSDVLLVPDLQYNLFSVRAVTRKGFSFHVKNNQCEVRNSCGDLSSVGVYHGQMFKMLFKMKKAMECYIVQNNSLQLWHERLGHININVIKKTDEMNVVHGMKIENKTNFFYEPCVLVKQAQRPHFSSKRIKAEKPGEVIYSDVCGPINVESLGGSRYFLLFKDDCTGFRCIYFLRHKSEVLCKFKEYEALIYRQTNNKIKILRSDNGKEYVLEEFQNLLKLKGFVQERSTPYVPQQNGRAEREMRTLVESARSMLIARNLPKYLWAEAVKTAAYILNRTVTKQLEGKTAYEKWFGRKPEVQHMRIFGSNVYQNIPKLQRKKLDKKSCKMIFVGYEGESTNYRLWDEKSRKIYTSCDVTFNEEIEKITADEDISKQSFIDLDFGNYDESIEEEEEGFESAESSSVEDNNEVPQSSNGSVKCDVQQIGRQLRDKKYYVHLIGIVSSVTRP